MKNTIILEIHFYSEMANPIAIIKLNDDSTYAIFFDGIKAYIDKFVHDSNFAFVMNFGFPQLGKSTFSQYFSNTEHEIGKGFASTTKGAILSYCGTVQDIINRLEIDDDNSLDKNTHIFNIDTEGIAGDNINSFIELLFPLVRSSSLIIMYGMSFTDYSILSSIENFYYLMSSNIIISIKKSTSIIEKDQNSIDYYLEMAKSSNLGQKLELLHIESQIIPCVDFRKKVKYEFSHKMNKYFITQVLNQLQKKNWNSSEIFIEQLKESYSEDNKELVNSLFSKEKSFEVILDSIKNDCLQLINSKLNSNEVNYDELKQEVTLTFNSKCRHFEIDENIKNENLNNIIEHINLRQIRDQMMQGKEVTFDEDVNTNVEQYIELLSIQISEISNVYILLLLNDIKNKDISSLNLISCEFIRECNKIILDYTAYLPTQLINYIYDDVNKIAQTLQQNSSSALAILHKLKFQKIFHIFRAVMSICISIVAIVLKAIGRNEIASVLLSLPNIFESTFKDTNDPSEDNFVINVGGHKYEANYDDIKDFLIKAGITIADNIKDLYQELQNELEVDLSRVLPVCFKQRDYMAFYEKMAHDQSE